MQAELAASKEDAELAWGYVTSQEREKHRMEAATTKKIKRADYKANEQPMSAF